MYSQAQCTIVLCELFAMTKDDALRGPAQRAIDFAESAQGETVVGATILAMMVMYRLPDGSSWP